MVPQRRICCYPFDVNLGATKQNAIIPHSFQLHSQIENPDKTLAQHTSSTPVAEVARCGPWLSNSGLWLWSVLLLDLNS